VEFLGHLFLIIAINREIFKIILDLTPIFLDLVKKATRDSYNKTILAQEKLAKLNFTSSYIDIEKEFKRVYLFNIH
jgi:hypothetical protein